MNGQFVNGGRAIAVTVGLDLFEPIWIAAIRRRIDSRQRNMHHRDGMSKNADQLEIEGCCGEWAVSRCFNLPWHQINPGGPDVGRSIEVRSIPDPSLQLLLHEDDRAHEPVILANVGDRWNGTIYLLGWGFGDEILRDLVPRDASKPDALHDMKDPQGKGRWCFMIPHKTLRKMSEFLEHVDHQR